MSRHTSQRHELQPISAEDALVFDISRFEANTMYDFALQCEILGLIQSQIEQMRVRLSQGGLSAEESKFVGHTLRGAAAAVGALELEDMGTHWVELGLAGHDLLQGLILANERFKQATRQYKL